MEELKKTNYRDPNKSIVINSLLRKEEKLEVSLIDKENIKNNQFEVIQQVHDYHKGKFSHIYDLVLLINGLPLVCIELKKATIFTTEAFSQLKRYFKDRLVSEPLSIFNNFQLLIATNFQRVSYFWRRDISDLMYLERLTLRWCNHDSFQQLKWVNVLFSPSRIIEQLFKSDTRFSEKLKKDARKQQILAKWTFKSRRQVIYSPSVTHYTKRYTNKIRIFIGIVLIGLFLLINFLSHWAWWTILIGILLVLVFIFETIWTIYKKH